MDNKSKLEVIRQEEKIIRREKEERMMQEEAEKLAKAKVLVETAAKVVEVIDQIILMYSYIQKSRYRC